MPRLSRLAACLALLPAGAGVLAAAPAAGIDWVRVGAFEIARTETTVGQFRAFAAATGTVTRAERDGGGEVYEAGWVRKPGWTWRAPFGAAVPVRDDEPAVHVTWHEAAAFCRWAGGRLPTDAEWGAAAYTEQRAAPPAPFERGRTYRYPTGDSPQGAQCLDDCGPAARERATARGTGLTRGFGHAPAGSTPAGVNGLHEMGANAWEWVDEPAGARGDAQRRTRGGSWWYGAGPMRDDHRQAKPADTAVVYIGFRCARDAR
ncbi:MAG: formylglycine-generating enzyme family protein [Rubrivivax sp.]|jgi:formylglycine-generating enzyme required for sulfatase activity|nr:formylglycine-generating enzyme family protein [Rubrivivax sp.]